jgi:lipopolysaccharide transport system permease protein
MNPQLLYGNLRLAWDLARRDLASAHRRSLVGIVWIVLTPLGLLGIYSMVFGAIFGVEWKNPHHGAGVGFVLPFFVGLVMYLALSDVVNSSAVLFASRRTYVVKSPFPIWVLWVANLMRAGVHALVGLGLVLIVALFQGRLTMPGVAGMLVGLLLALLFLCGISLLLASLGPFIGDISEATRLLLRVLFYATPITYPLTMVSERWRDWMWFNPLAVIVELLRSPIVFGTLVPARPTLVFLAGSLLLGAIALWVFRRVSGVISDVV